MACIVNCGRQCVCSCGQSPAPLVVTPENRVMVNDTPAATISDHVPLKNIPSFGMCGSLTNPANQKGAARVPFTAPCTPVVAAPWVPGNVKCLINKQPALTDNSSCMCAQGGMIRFTPASVTVTASS